MVKLRCITSFEQILFAKRAGTFKQYVTLNKHQKSILEQSFEVQPYPNETTLKEIALQTGLRKRQVYGWFVRRRSEIRRGKFKS